MTDYSRFLKLIAMSWLIPSLSAVALSAALMHGVAAHEHDHERRGHGAHVHGTGTLNLAVETDEIEIELISPGHDLVGFEHAPRGAEDKAAVEKVIAGLRDGAGLFVFPAVAGCRLDEAKVETGMTGEESNEARRNDGHEHGHEAGHDSHGETHAEFRAHYDFRCEAPARAAYVDVKLFERFPGIEKLNARVLSSAGQSAHELVPSAARLKF
ncbi:MAG: DUF2796 domain-containing protein [Acetobacterales bacterium]